MSNPKIEVAKIHNYLKRHIYSKSGKLSIEDKEQLRGMLRITDLPKLKECFLFYFEFVNFLIKTEIKKGGVLFDRCTEEERKEIIRYNTDLKKSYQDCSAVRNLWATPKGIFPLPSQAALRFRDKHKDEYPTMTAKDVIRRCTSSLPEDQEWTVIPIKEVDRSIFDL